MIETAIVIGGNHHNTLGLIRGLGRKGVMSSLILQSSSNNNYVLKSKYITDFLLVKSDEDIINALRNKRKKEKQVIICTSDGSASVIDRNRNELKDFYYLPGCEEQNRLTTLMNKETMSKLAEECGLRIPKSIMVSRIETNLKDIPYPCITKPILSIEGSKADIVICQNEDELRDYLNQSHTANFQIQEYILKTMEYQLIGVVKDDCLIPGRSRIITQPQYTNTGFLRYEKLDGNEPMKQSLEFLKRTGYSGLFSMEFIRDAEGNDYFMEINFRNDGNSICVTDAGVNLPYIWYKLCTDSEYSLSSVDSTIHEIFVMPEFNEIDYWCAGQISFNRMVREFKQSDTYMEYAIDDPHPTGGMRGFWFKLLKAIIKKTIKGMMKEK